MSILAKRVALVVLVVVAIVAAGCGRGYGGGGTPPPPKFSNASLVGQYAFSMSGTELCAGSNSFFTRAGTFTADGKGNIVSGLEDINVCNGVATLGFTGGTYFINPNGRGTLSLVNNTGTTNYSITLPSTTQGFIAQTDVDSTAGGSFQRQNSAAFSNPAIAGGYVFDFKGVDVTASVVSAASFVGRFDADGAGHISSGLFDSNIAGTLSGQQTFPAGAFYQVDTNGDGSAFGRGTAKIAGQGFAFYVVDATRLKFVGTSFPSAFAGDAVAQQNIAFNDASLGGSFAFLISGSTSAGSIATGGRFTADGAGKITNVVADENNSGTLTLLPNGTVTGSYAVDANQFGGGTLTWTDTKSGTFSFIFYLISPTQAVFQETDSQIVSDGTFSAQTTTPISAAALAGDYAFSWSGAGTDAEDFVGQFSLTSSGNLTGKIDFNEFATGRQFFDIPLSGSITLGGDGTQANTATFNLQITPADTFQFTAYVVNQNTVFLVGVDTTRVLIGTMTRQP